VLSIRKRLPSSTKYIFISPLERTQPSQIASFSA